MSDTFEDPDAARRLLSALADGEADAADCAQASAAWAAGDAATRGGWHAYHLIGDVLRSEDLAVNPGRDEAFLKRLRQRLMDEPAVLAPQPLAARLPARLPAARTAERPPARWMFPVALAASVMGLGTVWAVLHSGLVGSSAAPAGPQMASASSPPGAELVALPASAETVAVGGKLVRDAQLDRYLRAHREYGAAAPGSLPGGAGRSIETVSLQR